MPFRTPLTYGTYTKGLRNIAHSYAKYYRYMEVPSYLGMWNTRAHEARTSIVKQYVSVKLIINIFRKMLCSLAVSGKVNTKC